MPNKYSTLTPLWSSSKIREKFINYFKSKNHKFIPSSSVNPKKDDGTYFVNAGMNQFKPVFLGTANIDYKRAVNSQKCIRIGGKHNDLEEVGRDLYHHTFFEMLGNWSFNDYYKKEACSFAWDLLTNVYHLDPSKLYVTYFKGSSSLGIEEDTECYEIWRQIGVPKSHIIGEGFKNNFWLMGDIGPCGPCTEIHYSRYADDAVKLVNSGNPDVMEIWNIVFMQYDKQLDGSINNLPAKNIDTGMGLERLTAILQNKTSNYDTDLFSPLMQHIQDYSGCRKYEGKLYDAVDIAYRIIADHSRMFTVTISDGLLPGTKDSENKLRDVIYRCIHECSETLQSKPGLCQSTVPIVANILGDTYQEINLRKNEVQSIIGETEERYFRYIKIARKILAKAINFYNSPQKLNVNQVHEIQTGKFGGSLSFEFIKLLANDFKVELPTENDVMELFKKTTGNKITGNNHMNLRSNFHKQDLNILIEKAINPTEDIHKYKYNINDSIYEFPDMTSQIVAIRDSRGNYIEHLTVGNEESHSIIFDRTNFYSESGGQASDFGIMKSKKDNVLISNILSAYFYNGYVFHQIKNIETNINIGDQVVLSINSSHRKGCMAAHTATHILHFCLNKVLKNVSQQGSHIVNNQLTFEFNCLKASVSIKELEIISDLANRIVESKLVVSRKLMRLEDALCLNNLSYLSDEIYPNEVTLVSIGDYLNSGLNASSELCGGSHVANTGDIEAIVITNFEGSIQGSKKIVAVTGSLAKKALENSNKLQSLLNRSFNNKNDVATLEKNLKEINKALSGGMLLPKVFRENVLDQLKTLEYENSNTRKRLKSSYLEESLQLTLEKSDDHIICLPFEKNRDMLEILVKLELKYPVFVLSSVSTNGETIFGLAYAPKEYSNFSVTQWVDSVCQSFPKAVHSPPKAKFSKHRNICVFSIPTLSNDITRASILKSAKEFKTINQIKLKNVI